MTDQLELEKTASTLVEALAWIRQFRDKMVVIKLDGSILENESLLEDALLDIHFMQTVGLRPVIVHGGGPSAQNSIQQAADDSRLKVAEQVLVDELNRQLSERFEKVGGRAMTLSFQSTPVLTGKLDTSQSSFGNVTEVDRLVIDNLCYAGQVPFIPAMCETEDGEQLMIVDADATAKKVAEELGAEKLIVVSDELPDTLGDSLERATVERRAADAATSERLAIQFRCALSSLENGVQKVHLVDSQKPHALLLEVYTDQGIGTVID